MNPDQIFSISNTLAMLAWIALIVFPFKPWTSRILTGVVIALYALVYSWLIFGSLNPADFESFGSLQGVMSLFTDQKAVVAGWIHYLAFDLMVGMYIVADAKKNSINRWLIVPCLFLTFMTGPFGLLLYFILRFVRTKKYFHSIAG